MQLYRDVIKISATVLFCLIQCALLAQSPSSSTVILVSFDGFRYDYADREALPHFQEMKAKGAAASSMIPSYPSKTFPNHYTLVTGLYPGHHGLVDNTFYDSITGQVFAIKKRNMVQDSFYYGGTPLWQLVQTYGMKSASFFWVGSEAPVAGRYPDYYRYYDDGIPDRQRIETVLEWLRLPEEMRPQFISLYFSVVDDVTHRFGPDASQSVDALHYADSLLGELISGVRSIDLPVNIIVVSDHGMYPMKAGEDKFLDPAKIMTLPEEGLRIVNNETHVHLYCEEPLRSELFRELTENESHYRAYLRENTPDKWHYNSSYRIGDIVIEAEPGYSFLESVLHKASFGSHGYDPYQTPEMHAIFYAMGPDIRPGVRLPSFENVHVYPLIALLLGLPAGVTDGDPEVLRSILLD